MVQGDPASNQIAGDMEISFSCIQDGADWAGINGNIDMNPHFTSTYLGDYFLSKREGVYSPCLNTGSGNAGDMGLSFMTTTSNLVHDSGRVDLGFHYPYFVIPFLEGDVDNNDMLDIVDALRVAQAYVGRPPKTFFYEAVDINRDKKMDILDALLIAQYFVGLNM